MPPHGEQHLNSGGRSTANPFEEVKPRISEYTAQEIMTLQSRLEKQLGPEYISSRSGPSGQKVHYIPAEKCIQLANEIFGFNGWSSQIMDIQVDFVDENPTTLKVSLGLSVIVRVTLKDGTFHEDVGYGHMENSKGKAAAFEKAKKEGTTDALKRALRNFGNVLGNCIYDKEYLQKVTKIKAPASRWDVGNLHRHSTCAPSAVKKEEPGVEGDLPQNMNGGTSAATEAMMEDEFGEFDEADFSVADAESHPDEVTLPAAAAASRQLNRKGSANSLATSHQSKASDRQQHATGQPCPPNVGQVTRSAQPPPQPQPQTPNSGFQRSNSGAGRAMQPPPDAGPQQRPPQAGSAGPPPIVGGRMLNQPSRTGPPSGPVSPGPLDKSDGIEEYGLPPQGAGFFSARAAAAVISEIQVADNQGPPPRLPTNLPAFDTAFESRTLRRTPGVDYKTSKPLTRQTTNAPSSSQAVTPKAGQIARPSLGNAQLDGIRRVGAPGSPNHNNNRGSYKPPTMKRPIDAGGAAASVNAPRTPLVDLPANGAIGVADVGGDAKRQRLNG